MRETKKQRTCFCCGTAYHYCPNCAEDANKPNWYFIFDSENCRDIFNICQKYSTGEYDAIQARHMLDKCDLTHKSNFRSDVKKVIKEIFAKSNKTARTPSSPSSARKR